MLHLPQVSIRRYEDIVQRPGRFCSFHLLYIRLNEVLDKYHAGRTLCFLYNLENGGLRIQFRAQLALQPL